MVWRMVFTGGLGIGRDVLQQHLHCDIATAFNFVEVSTNVPPQLNKFLLFQPLKFFYQIQLELNQIQLKNSNAIRFYAQVIPQRLALEIMPIALVDSIHCLGVRVKLLRPANFLNPSNSTGLNSGLSSCSQIPKNSTALRFRNQLRVKSSVLVELLYRAISVIQMYSIPLIFDVPISESTNCSLLFTASSLNCWPAEPNTAYKTNYCFKRKKIAIR